MVLSRAEFCRKKQKRNRKATALQVLSSDTGAAAQLELASLVAYCGVVLPQVSLACFIFWLVV